MYIQILSEFGLFGFFLFAVVLTYVYLGFGNLESMKFRKTGRAVMIAFLISALGGTHILNEINYSVILWIYFGLFSFERKNLI